MQSWDAASWDRPKTPMRLRHHLTRNTEAGLSRATQAAMEVATSRDLATALALATVAMAAGDQFIKATKTGNVCAVVDRVAR